jgi:hypothetical protein
VTDTTLRLLLLHQLATQGLPQGATAAQLLQQQHRSSEACYQQILALSQQILALSQQLPPTTWAPSPAH